MANCFANNLPQRYSNLAQKITLPVKLYAKEVIFHWTGPRQLRLSHDRKKFNLLTRKLIHHVLL